MLRAYMHGFFVDNRLYDKAKVLTDPFAYETYRAQRVQKKIDDERKSRISLVRKLPKVWGHGEWGRVGKGWGEEVVGSWRGTSQILALGKLPTVWLMRR